MYRFDSIYSFALELCIEVINLGVKLFTLQIVLLRRSGAGPSEHGGTIGIRPNHLFASTLNHSTKEWVHYTHNIGMSQATIKTVPPGLSRDLHTLQQKGSSILLS